MELFGTIFEQLAGKFEGVIDEALMCIATFASQNIRFKNAFLAQCFTLSSSRKSTILRLLTERLLVQTPQSNTSEMRLLF
jgi:hypothetical protein